MEVKQVDIDKQKKHTQQVMQIAYLFSHGARHNCMQQDTSASVSEIHVDCVHNAVMTLYTVYSVTVVLVQLQCQWEVLKLSWKG